MPAGAYHIYVRLESNDSVFEERIIQKIDSSLSGRADSRDELNKIYSPQKSKSFLGMSIPDNNVLSGVNNTYSILKASVKKVDRAFNKKGFTVGYRERGSSTLVDVYYQNRFVGYYELDQNKSMGDNIKAKAAGLQGGIGGSVNNELENARTVFSQVKELYEENKKKEVTGTISIAGNAGTGQEEYSQNENNFYEIMGQVEVPILNIPVSLEGYYTSQDKNRIAKASYIRLHYDKEQAKAELLKLIAAYSNKYDETVSKGKGLESVYYRKI